MVRREIYIAIIALLVLKEVTGRKKFKTLLFQSIESKFNPTYVNNYSLTIKEDRVSLNMLIDFSKDLPVDVWLHIVIGLKQPKSEKFHVIFAYDVNICSILSREVKNFNIVNLWMSSLMKFSNLPTDCPWKKGKYTFLNFRPEKDTVPGFILNGIYRIDIRFYLRDISNAILTNTSIVVDCKMK